MQISRDRLCTAVAVLFLCSLLPLLTPASLPVYPLDTAAVRQVVEAAMKCQSVRQFHAAVVHRDQELLKLQLELQADGRITELDGQLLYLASVSKGMFGTGLVRVEEYLKKNNPKFNLFSTPIKDLLRDSDFWFLDGIRSELVTIDDLISHRTGLARHEAMWFLRNWDSKEELIKHVSRLQATSDFRNSFVYNNLVWTLADVVVQKLTNRTFSQYMREFLWQPLGMMNTRGSSEVTSDLQKKIDFSKGNMPMDMPLPVPSIERSLFSLTKVLEAAGGIVTPLTDMMQYMKLHANQTYSAMQPVPGQFLPLNANAAGFHGIFSSALLNDSVVPNLPDWEAESYARGWLRSWYRNQLDYSHGGSLFGVRCELDVYSKHNLAVFNHMTLSLADNQPYQSTYPIVINKYISDLLLTNHSYVTKDNVCSLFRRPTIPDPIRLTRRSLDNNEVEMLRGSYGNYGFGKVQLNYNQTSYTMIMYSGFAVVELIPIQYVLTEKTYYFYLNMMEPVEFVSLNTALNRSDDAITVKLAIQSPGSYASVISYGNRIELKIAALGFDMVLIKDLEPSAWKRPNVLTYKAAGMSGMSGGRLQRLGIASSAMVGVLMAFLVF